VGQQSYEVATLPGAADDRGDADGLTVISFRQAQQLARKLHSERAHWAAGKPMPGAIYTVADAIRAHLDSMDRAGRRSAEGARTLAESMIVPVLGNIPAGRLEKDDLERWLDTMANTRPRVRGPKGEIRYKAVDLTDPEIARARRANANRVFALLRAGLNAAHRAGSISSNAAWSSIRPFRGAESARIRYLTEDEALRLVRAAEPAFGRLVQGALATGARYGELVNLLVEDFHPNSRTIHVRQSKSNKGRHVVLGDEGVELFESLCAGRPHDALIFVRSDGSPWRRSMQSVPMAAACAAAKIKSANFHCLRHTWASLSIMNGMPLMVAAKNLGHTDTKMVEKHYGHLAPSFVADAIRQHAPTFGFAKAKVAPLRSRRPA
jgi:integrase